MRIFSNFNTSLASEFLDEARTKYRDENILFIRRHSIYVILKVVVPALLVALIVGLIVIWTITWDTTPTMVTTRFIVYGIL
jgi:flagellar biosynthesis protein FlhB